MRSLDTHVPTAAVVPALNREAFVDPFVVDVERPGDVEARELLLDRAFGPARYRKTCQKLRAGRLPARGLSLVARVNDWLGGGAVVRGAVVDGAVLDGAVANGDIVGTVRLWHVDAGSVPALMLGPLAVDARYRGCGLGGRLMDEAISRAATLGHRAILLVGDAPYYARFGFAQRHTLGLWMPGPVEDERFLGLELEPDALAAAHGSVRATGAVDIAARCDKREPRLRRAA